MKTLHSQGVRTIIFIDDILVIAATAEECSDNVALTIQLLESLGFLINYEKSNLRPSQTIIYLGFIIASVPGTWTLPEAKVNKNAMACQNLLQTKQATLCDIAHVTGLPVSAFSAVRYLEYSIASHMSFISEAILMTWSV